MKKNFLTMALGAAIATFYALPSMGSIDMDGASFIRLGEQTLNARHIAVTDIPSALASTGNMPEKWHDRSFLNSSNPTIGIPITWISSASLSSEEARSEAADIIHSGRALLVSITPETPRYDISTFGVKVDGETILYRKKANGALDIYAIDSPLSAHSMVDHTLRTLEEDAIKPSEDGKDMNVHGPYVEFFIEKPSDTQNGSSTDVRVRVARDSSTNRDDKIVSVYSHAIVRPFRNGITNTGWPRDNAEDSAFVENGTGRMLYIAGQYDLKTMLAWPKIHSVDASKISHFPTATGSTEIKFKETRKRTTNFDWGVTADISNKLAKEKEEWIGKSTRKVGGSIGGGWQNTTEEQISMDFKDYSIGTEEAEISGDSWIGKRVQVDFPVAQAVRTNDYFYSSKGYVKTDKRTPMMKSADISSLVEWKLPGSYEGTIIIATAPFVQNMVWNENTTPRVRLDWPLSTQAPKIPRNAYFPDATQPVVTIEIDMGTPYLTRMPTTRIQTWEHANQCLEVGKGQTKVGIALCKSNEGSREQQWSIDDLGRYVHRGTGKCLVGNAEVTVDTCSNSLLQKWEWRNDRLHSKSGDGMKRLQLLPPAGSTVSSTYNPQWNDPLPTNITHILLRPWGGYPAKPNTGDSIPGFDGTRQPIPEHYLGFRRVDNKERWRPLPYLFTPLPPGSR